MQLLLDGSEEDDVECLGIVPGIAARLPSTPVCPVPNMGWCATSRTSHFYYLHSYALPFCDYTVATAEHAKPFSAVIGRDNFVATQFHPERSSAAGAQLLRNFLDGSS
jgi:glutamine amidotransferase